MYEADSFDQQQRTSRRARAVRKKLYGVQREEMRECYRNIGSELPQELDEYFRRRQERIELFEELNPGLPIFAKKLPSGNEVSGEIPLGIVPYTGAIYGIDRSELVTGKYYFGVPKSGKTNSIKCLISMIQRLGNINWIIVTRKYDDHLDLSRSLNVPLYDYYEDGIGLNPLHYPSNLKSVDQWTSKLAGISADSFRFFNASESVLESVLSFTYKVYGDVAFPTLYDSLYMLRNYYDAYSRKRREYSDVLDNRFVGVVNSNRKAFSFSESTIAYHIENNLNFILSIAGPTDAVFKFIALWIYLYLFFHCMGKGKAKEGEVRWVIVFEESHSLYFSDRDLPSSLPSLSARSREYGLAPIFVMQFPSALEPENKGLNLNRVVFPLASGNDISDASQMLHLSPEESQYLNHLQIGQAIVTKQGYPYPFPVQFPEWNPSAFGFDAPSSNQAVKKEFHTKPRIHIKDLPKENWKIDDPLFLELISVSDRSKKKGKHKADKSQKLKGEVLLFAKRRFGTLRDIVLPVSYTYSKLKISSTKANAIKKAMCDEGLLKEVRLSSAKGSDLVLLEPCPELMESVKVKLESGQGTIVHRAFQLVLARAAGGRIEFSNE